MRQTIKNIVAVAAAISATATVIQVAKANFLPQTIDKELQQPQSFSSAPFTAPLRIKPEDLAAPTDTLQSRSADLLQSDDLIAFADMQDQTAFSSLPAKLDSSIARSFDSTKAANSLAELPHLASLDQSQPLEPSTYSRDLGLAPRYDELGEPSRDTN